MKTRLLKKWQNICKTFDEKFFNRSLNCDYAKYFGPVGDKFFERYAKYSKHWSQIMIECDLNNCTPKGIHQKNHPLHRFCPSVRCVNKNRLMRAYKFLHQYYQLKSLTNANYSLNAYQPVYN